MAEKERYRRSYADEALRQGGAIRRTGTVLGGIREGHLEPLIIRCGWGAYLLTNTRHSIRVMARDRFHIISIPGAAAPCLPPLLRDFFRGCDEGAP